jgi:nitrate reductase cytochrome c-type subunit
LFDSDRFVIEEVKSDVSNRRTFCIPTHVLP